MDRWNIIAYRDPLGQREYKAKVAEDGEWVKYSDVEATERRLIEVEDMAAWYQQQHQQVVAEREALQARVRELEGAMWKIQEVGAGLRGNEWNNPLTSLYKCQIIAEKSLKGTP